MFFAILLVNALYPSVILHARAITVQRDMALYIDLILDFLYLFIPVRSWRVPLRESGSRGRRMCASASRRSLV